VKLRFGGLGIYNKLIGIFRPYNVNKHWKKRGEIYYSLDSKNDRSAQEAQIVEYLKKISFNSVLEFGCGYGRLTKQILDNFSVEKYVAFDLSQHQIYNAKNFCKDYNVDFQQSTIKEFNTKEKFDLVIGIEVLDWIKPEDIESTVRHLLGFTKKHLIHSNIGFEENYKITKRTKSFRHNFRRIYHQFASVNSLEIIPGPKNGSLFHVKVHEREGDQILSSNDKKE